MTALRLSFLLYAAVSFLLPASNLLSLKAVTFILLVLAFALNQMQANRPVGVATGLVVRASALGIFLLLYSLSAMVFHQARSEDVLFLLVSFSGLLVAVLLSGTNFDTLELLSWATLPLTAAVIAIALSGFFAPALQETFTRLFFLNNSGILGSRSFGGLELTMIHFRTSPVLILPATVFFIRLWDSNRRAVRPIELVLFGLTMAAVFLSASRGLILFTFLSLTFVSFAHWRKPFFFFCSTIMTVVGVLGLVYVLTRTNVFSFEETSNSIKSGHFTSFVDLITQSPQGLLFGFGFASGYYTSGFNDVVWQTELTLVDIFRYFGILGGLTLIGLLLLPTHFRKPNFRLIPYAFYFLNAMTNPLLFNSTGMLVLACFWLDFGRPRNLLVRNG